MSNSRVLKKIARNRVPVYAVAQRRRRPWTARLRERRVGLIIPEYDAKDVRVGDVVESRRRWRTRGVWQISRFGRARTIDGLVVRRVYGVRYREETV